MSCDTAVARRIVARGRVIYDAEAPDRWTLADPEDNELDIAVSVGLKDRWLIAHGE